MLRRSAARLVTTLRSTPECGGRGDPGRLDASPERSLPDAADRGMLHPLVAWSAPREISRNRRRRPATPRCINQHPRTCRHDQLLSEDRHPGQSETHRRQSSGDQPLTASCASLNFCSGPERTESRSSRPPPTTGRRSPWFVERTVCAQRSCPRVCSRRRVVHREWRRRSSCSSRSVRPRGA